MGTPQFWHLELGVIIDMFLGTRLVSTVAKDPNKRPNRPTTAAGASELFISEDY
jgi:hypothetical protein